MIEKLTAVREKFLNGSDSLFEFKADDPRNKWGRNKWNKWGQRKLWE